MKIYGLLSYSPINYLGRDAVHAANANYTQKVTSYINLLTENNELATCEHLKMQRELV